MISGIDIAAAIIILLCFGLLVYGLVIRPLLYKPPEEPDERSLDDPVVRTLLSESLARLRVVGNADIRGGVVLAAVSEESIHPLAVRLSNAYSTIRQLRNPASSSLYVFDSVGRRYRLIDLDLEDLGEAVRLLQHLTRE